MRKVLKTCTVLVLACIMVLGMVSVACAAGSKTSVVDVVKVTSGGAEIGYTVSAKDTAVPNLTVEKAAQVTDGVEVKDLDYVLWQAELKADKTPATFTFNCSVANGTPLYVYHYSAEKGDWEFVAKGTAPNVDATFNSLSPGGIVVGKTGGSSGGDTPKTGDSNIAIWAGILVVAAAGAVGTVVYGKKRTKKS